MGMTVGVLGESGSGKTTSIVTNKDGTISLDPQTLEWDMKTYSGLNQKSTVLINSDKKPLPFADIFPSNNVIKTSDIDDINVILKRASESTTIKSVVIDTINGVMLDREMLEAQKLTYDKWYDFARDIYALIINISSLKPDLIVYLMGHISLYTNVDGNESRALVTNGKKLEKIKLESKMSIVLFTHVDFVNGKASYSFETSSNRSTAHTPYGMFNDFLIPNSLSLVDERIRTYYKLQN